MNFHIDVKSPSSLFHMFAFWWTLLPLSTNVIIECLLNNLQNSEKGHFQTLRTFVFDLKVASKRTHYLVFPENDFNLVTQKFERKWKMLLLNPRNICFSPQGNFKTIFQNSSHDQLWIWKWFWSCLKVKHEFSEDSDMTFFTGLQMS